MSVDRSSEQAIAAWKDQPISGFRLSQTELRAKIRSDQRHMRRDHFVTIVAAVVCVLWFTGILITEESDPVRRLGLFLTVGGLAYVGVQLVAHRRRVQAARIDADRTTTDSVSAIRVYLRARYEFHSGIWLWSRFVALLPGVPIVAYGFARDPQLSHTIMVIPVQFVPYAWVAAQVCVALFVQRPLARRYKDQIEEVDRLERS